ncbi:predicted protein [Histoplasma capsulatum G186AR]|uniref:Uncharacterized protein n=2 Tax=Ajellomyces capsulatus TaxID=5037 RepID=C0NFA8_AJECG|nr:uncharacterized protein HCBG_01574 [Histoplasma capsulatum G186AR]EEH09929.1 predicted protein [Histoplasma capsulatum G186AR]KAG5298952.1 hypothetical protein I7I52_09093 [Histoplasma capsulatum]QSS73055.1 hypothetical protein I7I50_01085 [Histoplasma capsulatum G186AR]
MSTSTRADTARTSDNSQANAQQSAASRQRTANQSGLGQQQEISRWSPNTSSRATSTVGDTAQGPSRMQHSAGSTTATRGSPTSNTTSNISNKGNVEAARERTLSALEHGAQFAPDSERNAETLISAVTQNPQAAQQLSSSGRHAQDRRR